MAHSITESANERTPLLAAHDAGADTPVSVDSTLIGTGDIEDVNAGSDDAPVKTQVSLVAVVSPYSGRFLAQGYRRKGSVYISGTRAPLVLSGLLFVFARGSTVNLLGWQRSEASLDALQAVTLRAPQSLIHVHHVDACETLNDERNTVGADIFAVDDTYAAWNFPRRHGLVDCHSDIRFDR